MYLIDPKAGHSGGISILQEPFGKWLRKQRQRMELTQEALASKSGVSQTYISDLERFAGTAKEPEPSREKVAALANGLGVSEADALIAAGFTPGSSVSSETVSMPRNLPPAVERHLQGLLDSLGGSETIRLPLLGKIAAGSPLLASDNIEDYIYVSRDMVREDEVERCFVVRVQGRSMEGALIADRDLLIVLQQEDAEDGQIVAALVNNDEVTVKRLRRRRGSITLESDYIDGKRDEVPLNGGRILGIVIGQRRDYRRNG